MRLRSASSLGDSTARCVASRTDILRVAEKYCSPHPYNSNNVHTSVDLLTESRTKDLRTTPMHAKCKTAEQDQCWTVCKSHRRGSNPQPWDYVKVPRSAIELRRRSVLTAAPRTEARAQSG